ncbi:AraC family transcriptional regulator [Rubellicoccus peritrichatus]|uniref:AraC family transcriptional regulator n=1 Tax=Rubellicoccus peritrichatus TaxID=3080537 RepID=A0AAQ3L5C4_9BACT|nr:AraC family transcriptional regulator [Puniceicoccus sp. CR14]WOO39704.1 AraC family transcriptional regulator [Puniceicoccus sp. CR14]
MDEDISLPFDRVRLLNAPRVHQHPANWRWNAVFTGYYNLWIALGGDGVMKLDEKVHTFKAGTVFIIRPGQQVNATLTNPTKEASNYSAHFVPVNKDDTDFFPQDLPSGRISISGPGLFRELINASVEFSIHNDALAGRQVEGLVWQLLALVKRAAVTPPLTQIDRLISAQIEFLREHPEEDCSVEYLASEVGLSRSHYTRRFSGLAGLSPNAFHIQQRLRQAAGLLRDSSMTVTEIAEALGYRDVYFFSRQFKKHEGMSPLDYRQAPNL